MFFRKKTATKTATKNKKPCKINTLQGFLWSLKIIPRTFEPKTFSEKMKRLLVRQSGASRSILIMRMIYIKLKELLI